MAHVTDRLEQEGVRRMEAAWKKASIASTIQTVAVGAAIGQACLLLAAGKKGRRFMMPHAKAQEFGVIDKILWRGQEQIMTDAASPDEWDRRAGIKVVDGL
ncbi:hypothetical protein KSP40_PGU014230 [Platanthera guangdongensis]|uniref:Uncharacterized protein n=1 Tax=Platanthera guangdongensis TaxID=2320717 RepID=A0ABR2M8D1_9ASPA